MSNQPAIEVPLGAIRLNTDSQKLEFFDGSRWYEMATDVPTLDGGTRCCFSTGGDIPSFSGDIEFITMETAGNTTDFGNQFQNRSTGAGLSSRTRGVYAGGYAPTPVATMDFITFSSTGNALDFGDVSYNCFNGTGAANSTRGLVIGGSPSSSENGGVNNINYITFATTGNTQDFGDIDGETAISGSSGCNGTRVVYANGKASSTRVNTIHMITIGSLGDSTNFGDTATTAQNIFGGSNATRFVIAGGSTPTKLTLIEHVTMSSTGDATQFGDLTTAKSSGASGASKTRIVIAGGTEPGLNNTIEYVSIATGGNSIDFGDLQTNNRSSGLAGVTNGHGGL